MQFPELFEFTVLWDISQAEHDKVIHFALALRFCHDGEVTWYFQSQSECGKIVHAFTLY